MANDLSGHAHFLVGLPVSPSSARRAIVLALAALVCTLAVSVAVERQGAAEPASQFAGIAPAFVPNEGQVDAQVRFYAQGPGYAFYFTDDKIALSFRDGQRGAALHLTPVGANRDARLTAERRAPGTVSYLGTAQRHAGLPTYGQVRYEELWPGVDLVFRPAGGKLKYEFVLAPGADPRDIQLAYAGADGLAIGAAGNLLIDTPLGVMRDSRPVSYQRNGGHRAAVESRYRLESGDRYGFAVGGYDRSRELVIDPGLAYSTYLGGSGGDFGMDIAVDTGGSAYVTGFTESPDFPTTPGAFDPTTADCCDGFVTKLDPTGSTLEYSTYMEDFHTTAIAVDSTGSAFVTGSTLSTAFPTTTGAFDTTKDVGYEGLVVKLNPSGTAPTYSTYLGGVGLDQGVDIAIDSGGNAYVTGFTEGFDFPTTPGAFDTALQNQRSAFVTKLNASGSALSYSTYIDGVDYYELGFFGLAIAVDADGHAHLTGTVGAGSGFPTTAGAFDTTPNVEDQDSFVTKLNDSGTGLLYSTYLGGTDQELGPFGIDVDANESAYVTGSTSSPNFPTTPGAFHQSNECCGTTSYVTKLEPDGSALSYSTYLPGANAAAVRVDADGSAHVTGMAYSDSGFPTTPAAINPNGDPESGQSDAFVTKFTPTGASLAYSTFLGGTGEEPSQFTGGGIDVDGAGDVYVTGTTASSDFPAVGAYDSTLNGPTDAFVSKIGIPASGTLVVRKDTAPDDAADFAFVASGGLSPAAFQLDDDGDDNNGLSSVQTFSDVVPGVYGITESVPAGWFLANASCDNGDDPDQVSVSAGETVVCTFLNSRGYVRPKSAGRVQVPLVPAFQQCTTAQNRTHGPPLTLPACNPPQQVSTHLTIGTSDANGQAVNSTGVAVFRSILGDPATAADEADVKVKASITDVRTRPGLTDYAGGLQLQAGLRITDRSNDSSLSFSMPGSVQDFALQVPVGCSPTADTTVGSTCAVNTTMDAIAPGAVTERKRTVWALGQIQLFDGGADGDPLTAGNSLFGVQGWYVP